jgi:transposase
VDQETGATKRSVGRPSKAQPFRTFVVNLLLKQPNLRSLEIVRRARETGYEGGKSAFYSLIASVRPRRSRPLSEHDKVPGEISRHGFGQVDVRFRDGVERSVTFFVSRLEYSRFTTASIVVDQGLETCVRTLVAHYRAFGGVPLLAAFDRARPMGVGSDKDGRVQEWDPAFAYAALQIGLGVEVRARRGADRGPGTNLGNWLKLSFFKDATFADEADAGRQLAIWLREHNDTPQADAGGKTPAVLLAEERQRLRPLKIDPQELALRFPVLVGPRGVVVHEGQAYSMPPDSVGLAGALHLYPDRVSIIVGRYESTHPRHPAIRLLESVTPSSAGASWAPGAAVPLAARAG